MLVFKANYYSGASSRSEEIALSVNDLGFLSSDHEGFQPLALNEVTISPRVGNSMRYLTLPDGSKLETSDNDSVDSLVRIYRGSRQGLAHKLERSTKFIVLSIAALVFGAYNFVTVVIPASSAHITNLLPVSMDNRLGGEVLEQLDEIVFEPSALTDNRKTQLAEAFSALTLGSERDFKLRFRSSETLGANAFALPDAQIVFTDQLIEMSDDDAMVEAIMLHEIGHIVNRHSMQSVVRQAGISLAIVALTGDVNTAGSTLLVLLPAFLIQSQYSRDFENEADDYAFNQMLSRGIDPNAFADILEKMSETTEAVKQQSDSNNSVLEYFSSHPATSERIERFRNATKN